MACLPAETCRTGATGRRLQRRGRGAWRRLRRRSFWKSTGTDSAESLEEGAIATSVLLRGYEDSNQSEFVEHEEGSANEEESGDGVVPAQVLAEVEGDEDAEDDERDDFLDHFELHRQKRPCADAVGRDLEAVLEEGNATN